MVMVSASDLRKKLSEYLDRARAGEEVLVTEEGKASVRVRTDEPEMTEEQRRERARMERLAAQGVVRRGKGRIPKEFWEHEPVRLSATAPEGAALQAVLAEREESPY